MLKELETGYELVLEAWERFYSGDGMVYKAGNWTAEVGFNGESVVLMGNKMLFIFSAVTLVDNLLPKSNAMGGLNNIEFLVQQKYFGKLTVEEVIDGFETVDVAIKRFYKESINEYKNIYWKASVHCVNDESVDNTYIILAGYGYIFMFGIIDYLNQIRPMLPDGVEYAGLIPLIGRELDEDNSIKVGLKLSDTLWPSILDQRFTLFNTARYMDVLANKKISTGHKRILKKGYLNLSDTKAQSILYKNSDIKFSQTDKQKAIIEKYIPGFGQELLKKAGFDISIFKHFLVRSPIIYFLNEPRDRVIAQMCLWAYRQSLPEEKIDAVGYKEIREVLPFFEMNILDQSQADEIVLFILDYIKELKIMRVPKKFKEDHAFFCFDKLSKNWVSPICEISFDGYITNTIKRFYHDFLKSKPTNISYDKHIDFIDSVFVFNQSNSSMVTNNKILEKLYDEGFITVDEAVSLLFQDLSFQEYYGYKPESLRRWIYSQMSKGIIQDVGSNNIKILHEGIVKESPERLLNIESIKQIERMIKERYIKKNLVKNQVKKKGISERGARKRIKENMDKGLSIEDVARKIIR